MTKGFLNDDFDVPGDITAGGIESTPIGDTTPSTGDFTQVVVDDITINAGLIQGTAAAALNIAPTAGQVLQLDGSNCTVDDGVVTVTGQINCDNVRLDGDVVSYAGTAALTLHSIGAVTKTLQPLFMAYLIADKDNVTGDGTAYTIPWDAEIEDRNSDFASNIFTSPITGAYDLKTLLRWHDTTSSHVRALMRIVVSNREYSTEFNTYNYSNSSGNGSLSQAVLADMDAADTSTTSFTVIGGTKVIDIDGGATSANSYFMGSLIA